MVLKWLIIEILVQVAFLLIWVLVSLLVALVVHCGISSKVSLALHNYMKKTIKIIIKTHGF